LTYLNASDAFASTVFFLPNDPGATAALIDACRGAGEIDMMDQESIWQSVSTAPYDRDLELAVIEGGHVHPLVFACRRTTSGWVKVPNREWIGVSPTHWRPWHAKG
jgi:hypothetical protein